MKKVMSVVMGTVFVAGLSLTAASAFAGGACCASKEKASAEASMGGACTQKSSMASLLKSAPGTTMKYERVKGGVALVVTAASKEYVPVVQKAMMTGIDDMKVQAGATCTVGGSSAMKVSNGATCATSSSAVKVSDGATCTKTASASAVKVSEGATCTKTASASAASATCAAGTEKASMASNECPEWMKVLCGANCTVTNTATGVTIQWTTSEKNMVEQVQVAGEKLHADLTL